MLATIERRAQRLLARRGVSDKDGSAGEDAWSEREPVLAGLAAASVQGRVALGARAGAAVRRCGGSPDLAALSGSGEPGPSHARRSGFDLHAGVVVPARDRARLDRLCRYALAATLPSSDDADCSAHAGRSDDGRRRGSNMLWAQLMPGALPPRAPPLPLDRAVAPVDDGLPAA